MACAIFLSVPIVLSIAFLSSGSSSTSLGVCSKPAAGARSQVLTAAGWAGLDYTNAHQRTRYVLAGGRTVSRREVSVVRLRLPSHRPRLPAAGDWSIRIFSGWWLAHAATDGERRLAGCQPVDWTSQRGGEGRVRTAKDGQAAAC
jgi:hypothetical protein